MPYQPLFFPNSRPFEIGEIPDATDTEAGVMSAADKAKLDSLSPVSAGSHAVTELFVGVCNPPLPLADQTGSAVAPFESPQIAVAALVADGIGHCLINVAPGDYTAYGSLTIPRDFGATFRSGLTDGAKISDIIIKGSSDDKHQVSFFGFDTNSIDFQQSSSPLDTGICIFVGVGNVTGAMSITNTGGILCAFLGAGILDPSSLLTSVTINGIVDMSGGAISQFIISRCDVQQNVTATLYSSAESRNPAVVNCLGTSMFISEAEQFVGFYGTPVYTFTGGAGQILLDVQSAITFGQVGGDIVNGEPVPTRGGPRLVRCDTAFADMQVAKASSAGHVTLASGNASGDSVGVVGVVSPSVAINKLGLLWGPAGAAPTSLPLADYYRGSAGDLVLYSALAPGDDSIKMGVSDGQTFAPIIGDEFTR